MPTAVAEEHGRLKILANKCRKRGGSCGCGHNCQAWMLINDRLLKIASEQSELDHEKKSLRNTERRLTTPLATLKEGFKFQFSLSPVMVFDGDEASFGYVDEDGDWVDGPEHCNGNDWPWPFNEQYIWPDDCERFGIRVE